MLKRWVWKGGDQGFYESSIIYNEGLLLLFVSGLTQFEFACLLELSSDGWSGVVGNSVDVFPYVILSKKRPKKQKKVDENNRGAIFFPYCLCVRPKVGWWCQVASETLVTVGCLRKHSRVIIHCHGYWH